jgi:uncharacterized protein (TIGR01777 family)
VKVLVSGSHGLIGTALVERLLFDGHQVVRLQRPARAGSATPSGSVAWDPANNLLDPTELAEAGPFGAVVNLAGAGIGDRRWSAARKQEVLESRTRSTSLLSRSIAALDPRPAVMVSASAIGWYGDRGDEELTEQSTAGSGFLADVCRAWEEETAPAAQAGVRVVQLRSGIVVAPNGGAVGRLLPLFKLGLGARLSSGRQYMSWISLRDEVGVIVRALTDDHLAGPVNAVSPQPLTNADFTRAVGRALHRPTVLAAPTPALHLLLGRQMADEVLLASQRVLPARLDEAGYQFEDRELGPALSAMFAPYGVA